MSEIARSRPSDTLSAETQPVEVPAPPATASDPGAAAAARLAPGLLQRKLARRLARKAGADASGIDAGAEHAVASAASASGGAPLPATLQRKFEGALGADLSQVRVHTGSASAEASEAVGARAYTLGNDVHFNRGEFDPSSSQGEHLLAHEVAHTVQQAGGAARRQYQLEVSAPGDSSEVEADAMADAMVSGAAVAGAAHGAGGVSRQAKAPAATDDDTLKRIHALLDGGKPADLEKNVHEVLGLLGHLSEAHFQAVVDRMTPAQTQILIAHVSKADQKTQHKLLQHIKSERAVGAALGMKDKLYWAGPSGSDVSMGTGSTGEISTTTHRPTDDMKGSETNTNDFATWVRGLGPEPTDSSKMNCWEGVMFSAFKAGVIPKAWIVRVHQEAAKGDYSGALERALGIPGAKTLDPKQQPQRGDLVFFDGLAHVALSLGTKDGKGEHEILSLWILPLAPDGKLNSHFQKTTIEAVNGAWVTVAHQAKMKVTFQSSPW